ncbi:MAG TPA: cytochrome c [Thermodesulfobacteriota bacterium]
MHGAALLLAASLVLAAGCQRVQEDWQPDLARMLEQPRYDPYGRSRFFADGRVMQPPPAGTVPRDRIVGQPALTQGMRDGAYVDRIPIPVTRALVERGRDRFDVFCAACHGVAADGESAVAAKMALRRPPSLVDAAVRAFPPGRVYRVIREGYGLMPSYAHELSVEERWGVVAYLRALQLAQGVTVDRLAPDLRRRVEAVR